VPASDGQKEAAAALGKHGERPTCRGASFTEEKKQAPIFIVASPRPQVGKTFVARLLVDFQRLGHDDPVVFDLNPRGDALKDYFPDLATVTDLNEIKSQMAMFDRLIVDDGLAKIVDLGHSSFERFFAISEEIGFFREAARRSLDPVILFAANSHPVAINAYADLKRRLRGVIIVPVLNEEILKGKKLREEFPFAHAAAIPVQIPTLAPMLKAQIEKSLYSFSDVHGKLPIGIPIGLAFELRSWTWRTFIEFRELELRLLLEKLRASLPVVGLRQHTSREAKRWLRLESGYMPIYHRQFWDMYEQMHAWCERQHHEGWPSPELERWATLVKTALWQLAHTKPTSEFVLALLAEYTDKLEAELNSPPPGAPACWT
jgi:hypothetical protein